MTTMKHMSLGLLFLCVCPALSLAEEVRLSGRWEGTYSYPEGVPVEPVKFDLIMVHEEAKVEGTIKEPNTFGPRNLEPWLHADFKGTFDEKTGKLTYTKTYDGTAGVSHDVEYIGTVSKDGQTVEGKWTLPGLSGTFTLKRKKLADPK